MTAETPTTAREAEMSAAQIDDVCLSYRHDFGLLSDEEKSRLRAEARWWLHAWRKTITPSLPESAGEPAAFISQAGLDRLKKWHRHADAVGVEGAPNAKLERVIPLYPSPLAPVAAMGEIDIAGLIPDETMRHLLVAKDVGTGRARLNAILSEIGNSASSLPAAPDAGAGVPSGWELVPIEPTEEIARAGWEAAPIHPTDHPPSTFYPVYRAMLSAAPSPYSSAAEALNAGDAVSARKASLEAAGFAAPPSDDAGKEIGKEHCLNKELRSFVPHEGITPIELVNYARQLGEPEFYDQPATTFRTISLLCDTIERLMPSDDAGKGEVR